MIDMVLFVYYFYLLIVFDFDSCLLLRNPYIWLL
jgi:hypothetical protein